MPKPPSRNPFDAIGPAPSFNDLVNRAMSVNPASQPRPEVVNLPAPRLATVNPVNVVNQENRANAVDTENQANQPRVWDRPGRKLFGVRIPSQLLEKFDFWCDQRRMEKQYVIQRAVEAVLDGRLTIEPPVNRVNGDSPDDWLTPLMIDDAEGIDIISHYARWTGTKPKQTDLEALRECRRYPVMAVKCGVLMSVLRAKAQINSLRYCLGAVAEAASGQIGDLSQYLEYLERKARRAGKGNGKSSPNASR